MTDQETKGFNWKYLIPFYGFYLIYKSTDVKKGLSYFLNIIVTIILIGIIANIGENESSSTSGNSDDKITSENTEPKEIGKPDQIKFHAKLKEFKIKYAEQDNELKKSAVYREMVSFLRSYLGNGRVVNWEGQLTDIGTNEGGQKLYIKIESEFDDKEITYATWNNELSDMLTYSMIPLNSSVYKDVEKLNKGDNVLFTAAFISDSKRGFNEQSLMEEGFVDDPVFTLKFISVKKKDK